MTETIEVSNYKDVNGILYPHTLTISNSAMPMPLKLEIEKVKINAAIDESVFTVE